MPGTEEAYGSPVELVASWHAHLSGGVVGLQVTCAYLPTPVLRYLPTRVCDVLPTRVQCDLPTRVSLYVHDTLSPYKNTTLSP
eukprot:2428932-Rhodomonas_salina.1